MTDERAAAGVEHLQAAAREMIAAARAFLDVAEELVEDRQAVGDLVGAVGSVAQGAARAVRESADQRAGGPGHDDPDAGVQHIRVS